MYINLFLKKLVFYNKYILLNIFNNNLYFMYFFLKKKIIFLNFFFKKKIKKILNISFKLSPININVFLKNIFFKNYFFFKEKRYIL